MVSKSTMARFALVLTTAVVMVCALLVLARVVHAKVTYPPAALLQTGDITGTHIRDRTVTGVDVSTSTHLFVDAVTASSTATTSKFVGGVTLGASGITYSDGTSQVTAAGNYLSHLFTANEAITAGQAVSVLKFATSTGAASGSDTGEEVLNVYGELVGQTITIPATVRYLHSVNMSLFKTNNPPGQITWAFAPDANDDGLADSAAIATGTISATTITDTSSTGTYYESPVLQSVTPGAKYVWYMTGQSGCCGTDYNVDTVATTSYTGGKAWRSTDGFATAAEQNYDLLFTLTGAQSEGDRVALAASSSLGTSQRFIGFAKTSAAADESVAVVSHGLLTGLSGLYAGYDYTIGTAAGSITRQATATTSRVGWAVSTSTLYVERGSAL